MNLAIHQPQYIPWTPYFVKIMSSDVFIFLDSVDFQKNGLQNRNQIKTAQGPLWLTVPVKQRLGQKIFEVEIDNRTNWRRKHLQTIQQSYGKAKYFGDYAKDLEDFYSTEWTNLNVLNIEMTTMMLGWMGIHTPFRQSSKMSATGTASDLVRNLCLEVNASKYISGIGGKNYLEEDKFEQAGIEVIYESPALPVNYPQLHSQVGFINDLSALDLILNSGEFWREYIAKEAKKA